MVLPLQKYAQPLETAKTIDHCRIVPTDYFFLPIIKSLLCCFYEMSKYTC